MNTPPLMTDNLSYTKADSWKMFNRISRRYDFLNRLLSFGLDVGWRKKLTQFLPEGSHLNILDLATGTADVLLYVCKKSTKIEKAVGLDMAEEMLKIGMEKVKKEGLVDKITLQKGDANAMSYADNSFDVVTIAFGIRNVSEPTRLLKEMYRVLKKGGRGLISEFSLPTNRALKLFYLFYLRHILPAVGAFLSGDPKAYRYLNETIEAFPYGEDFCNLMRTTGFQNVNANRLTFGTATIYQGDKL